MARLSTRFSRYFTRRSRTSTRYSVDLKSKISRPLPLEEDKLPLTSTNLPYSISDNDAIDERAANRQPRDLEAEIDDILAQYQYTPTNADVQIPVEVPSSTLTFRPPPSAPQRIEKFAYTPPPAPSYKKLSFGMEVWHCSPSESISCNSLDIRGHYVATGVETGWGGSTRSCNVNDGDGRRFSRKKTERVYGDCCVQPGFGDGRGTIRWGEGA